MSFDRLPIGDKAPEVVNVVVEIPQHTSNKFEYDEELGVIMLDRVLHSPMYYPTEYGFIPGTRSEDGDMLDIMVITSYPTFPGCLLAARPVGILDMEDEEGVDPKILAVAAKDPHFKNVKELDDVNEHLRAEIGHFFAAYKELEDKWAKVAGWKPRTEALTLIGEARQRFNQENKSE